MTGIPPMSKFAFFYKIPSLILSIVAETVTLARLGRLSIMQAAVVPPTEFNQLSSPYGIL